MLKNIIKIRNKDEPNHFIVRQSKYILFFTTFLGLLGLLFLLISMYGVSEISVSWEDAGVLGQFFGGLVGIFFVILQLCIWGFILAKLVNYFYSFTVIEDQNVTTFKYRLFFEEEVHSAELYRILTIEYFKNGVLESFCNYGDIRLQMQNDTAIVINNVPRPKFIVSKIEQLKDYAIKNRIQGSEEELPRSEKTKAGIHIPHELREEIKEEVYEDLRDEIKREVKQEFKENLKTEILDEMH